MKDSADKATVDLFLDKKGPGRPVTGKAKTNAERMREYRIRRKSRGFKTVSIVGDLNQSDDLFNEIQTENAYLRKELDAALKLVDKYRNALQQFAGDL
ncbi:MAG TPA: hypothetical protein VIF37_01450 [Methylobacter sp.]|jgi:hypothetical protein